MVVRWHKTAMNDLKEFFEVTKLNNPKDYIQQFNVLSVVHYRQDIKKKINYIKKYL